MSLSLNPTSEKPLTSASYRDVYTLIFIFNITQNSQEMKTPQFLFKNEWMNAIYSNIDQILLCKLKRNKASTTCYNG